MQIMMACASHAPLLNFPARESSGVLALRAALTATRDRICAFDPDLIVLFGCDHYGGHQMVCMPAFCVGVEATALPDVGGTPGRLDVPRDIAVASVNALREDGVDVAISYAMDVDHGFSQILQNLTGGVATYPVLPIFVSCLQPPFVPFKRARALAGAVARFIATLDAKRVLILGTGGLSHDPSHLFPPIDTVSVDWKPYHLLGKRQSLVPQQSWLDYQIDMHRQGAHIVADPAVPIEGIGVREPWDRAFLRALCEEDLARFDAWTPASVVESGGFGAMEILSWICAAQTLYTATGTRAQVTHYGAVREVAVGFGIVESAAAPLVQPL